MVVRRVIAVLMLVSGLVAGMLPAWAAPRTFPATAQCGTMVATVYPQVQIDGKTMLLSPGAKIFSRQNTIVMHSTLLNNALVVKYTIDAQGYIKEVWILTDEELAVAQQ